MNKNTSNISSEIVPVKKLSPAERADMFKLMTRYFNNLDAQQFYCDLSAKPWSIILRNSKNKISGFSTLDLMETRVEGQIVRAVYSGDTIIDKEFRRTSALSRAFLDFIVKHTSFDRDESRWFWFYVCKGFRTYRFLSAFYRCFYPHPDYATPIFEQKVIDCLAMERFGAPYDRHEGVVRVTNDYMLRTGVSDLKEGRTLNPYIRFFTERNPGWVCGEELVCLAQLTRENLHSRALRWLDEMTHI